MAGALRHSIFVCELSLFLWHHPLPVLSGDAFAATEGAGQGVAFCPGRLVGRRVDSAAVLQIANISIRRRDGCPHLDAEDHHGSIRLHGFFASPYIAITHLWKDRGYRWSAIAPLLGRGWYRRLVIPNLVMNWVVWIPSLIVIYSLPTALQSHVSGLIGGFWALMSLQIAAHTQK